MEIEVLLVTEAPRKWRWQSKLPPDEVARRLREVAEQLEAQIADGRYDELLAAAGR